MEDRSKPTEEGSSSDGFSSLDECDTGELNNPTSTPEGLVSDMSDLDDLNTEDQSDHIAESAQPPNSPPQFEGKIMS